MRFLGQSLITMPVYYKFVAVSEGIFRIKKLNFFLKYQNIGRFGGVFIRI